MEEDSTDIESTINVPPDKPGYYISLDNIDLNLLPFPSHRNRTDVPAWGVPGPQYLEFVVCARDKDDYVHDSDNSASHLQRCHMCEVDVPASWFSEHIASARHRAAAAIVEISLERARRQVAVPSGSHHQRQGTYFCQHCSQAVNTNDANTHNQSDEHQTNKSHDDLLTALMLLYKDRTNYAKVCLDLRTLLNAKSKVASDIPQNSFIDENPTSTYHKELNRFTSHKTEPLNEGSDRKIKIVTTSKAKLLVDEDDFHGFSCTSGKVVCKICQIVVGDESTKAQHIYHQQHLQKLHSSLEDKHCIRKLDSTLNYCILCNEVIENPEAHIVASPTHGKALNRALIDDSAELQTILTKNHISTTNFNQNMYFCSPCQMYIAKTEISDHIEKDFHEDSCRNFKGSAPKTKSKEYYCNFCNLYFPSKKSSRPHRISEYHKYQKWLAEKDAKLHHHFEKSRVSGAICTICTVAVPNVKQYIDEHVKSQQHRSTYTDLLAKNKMEVLNEKFIKCHACNKEVLIFEELTHIKKKAHKYIFLKECSMYESGIQFPTSVKYKTLEDRVEASANPAQASTNNNPGTAVLDSVEPADVLDENFINIRNDTGLYHCNPCKLSFHTTELINHINTETHQDLVHININKNKFENNFCSICSVNVSVNEKRHRNCMEHRYQIYMKINERNGGYQFASNDSVNKYTCRVCCVEVDADEMGVKCHLDSTVHRNTYTKLMEENFLSKRDKKYAICNLCNVNMLFFDELNHINSKNHIKKLTSRKTIKHVGNVYNPHLIPTEAGKDDLSENDSSQSNDPAYTQNETETSKKMSSEALNKTSSDVRVHPPGKYKKKIHYVYTLNETGVTCQICKIFVDFTDMLRHRQSESHKQRFRDELDENTMFRLDSACFCACCWELIELPCEFAHLTSNEHLDKLSRFRSNKSGHVDHAKVKQKAEAMFYKYKALQDFNIKVESKNSATSSDSEQDVELPQSLVFSSHSYPPKENVSPERTSDSEESYASAKTHININPISDNKKDADKDIDLLLLYEHIFKKENNTDESFCEICKCHVPSQPDQMIKHMEDDEHKSNYRSVLTSNSIKKSIDGSKTFEAYFCEKCNLVIPKTVFTSHLNSESHKNNLAAKLSTSKDNIYMHLEVPAYFWTGPSYDKDPFYMFKAMFDNAKSKGFTFDPDSKTKNDNKTEILETTEEIDEPVSSEGILLGTKTIEKQKYPNKETPELDEFRVTFLDNNPNIPYCTVCKAILPNSDLGIKGHLIGNRHKNNLEAHTTTASAPSATTAPQSPIAHILNKTPTLKTNIAKSNIKEFFNCDICNTQMFNEPQNIEGHINSKKHKETFARLTEKEKSDYLASESGNLAQLITAVIESTKYIKEKTTSNAAISNSSPGSSGDNSRTSDMKSLGGSKNTSPGYSLSSSKESLLHGKATMGAKLAQGYQCTVCNVSVPNNPSNIAAHNRGQRHKQNAALTAAKGYNSSASNRIVLNTPAHIVDQNQQQGKDKKSTASTQNNSKPGVRNNPAGIKQQNQGTSHKENVKATANVGFYYCAVCNVKVPNYPTNIDEHNRGTTHSINARQQNIKGDSEHFECNICNVKIPLNNPHNVTAHVRGKKHLDALKFQNPATKQYYCSTCNSIVPNAPVNIFEHYNGTRHKENAKLKTRQLSTDPEVATKKNNDGLAPTSKVYTCYVCGLNIPNDSSSIEQHNQGMAHRKNSEKNDYMCTICDVYVPNNNISIQNHLQGAQHKEKVKNIAYLEKQNTLSTEQVDDKQARNVYRICNVCNINVPNNPTNIQKHKETNAHKTNLEKKFDIAQSSFLDILPEDAHKSNAFLASIVNLDRKPVNETSVNNTEITNEPSTSGLSPANSINSSNNIINNKTNINEASDKHTPQSSDSDDNQPNFYICKVCKVRVLNDPIAIRIHNNTYKHSMNELNEEFPVNYYECKVCKVKVENDSIKIKTHNDNPRHEEMVQKLLEANYIKITKNKTCHCELCDLYFSKVSATTHIMKETHILKLEEHEQSTQP